MTIAPENLALIPPPADAILIYAAYGWAKANGYVSHSGRPRLLERKLWVPLFYALAQTESGLLKLRDYADSGLKAWNVPPSIASCLDAAFADKDFDKRLLNELQHLADTSEAPRGTITLRDIVPAAALSDPQEPVAETTEERPAAKATWRPGHSKGPSTLG